MAHQHIKLTQNDEILLEELFLNPARPDSPAGGSSHKYSDTWETKWHLHLGGSWHLPSSTILKVENKLQFAGECSAHCLAPVGYQGFTLPQKKQPQKGPSCYSHSSDSSELSKIAIYSPKLPPPPLFILGGLWWACITLTPLSALGTTTGQSAMALQRDEPCFSRGHTTPDPPEQSPPIPAPSRVLFLPHAPLPHSCRLQLLIATNKAAEQLQMNQERSAWKQRFKSSPKAIILQLTLPLHINNPSWLLQAFDLLCLRSSAAAVPPGRSHLSPCAAVWAGAAPLPTPVHLEQVTCTVSALPWAPGSSMLWHQVGSSQCSAASPKYPLD